MVLIGTIGCPFAGQGGGADPPERPSRPQVAWNHHPVQHHGNTSAKVNFLVCRTECSVPLKTTDEVDWINPLKQYIRQTYDDPDKFSEVLFWATS